MWGGTFTAYYSTPEGGKILSSSELLQQGKMVYHEFERFEVVEGAIAMRPFPEGKAADAFRLAAFNAKEKKAVFENPRKDYPTRIVYQRVADDQLVITLSDPHGTSGKTETFDLRRAR
jgi:hypothetical protein